MTMQRWRRLLIAFRLRAGLSQNALAGEVGCNASYINRLESGERNEPRRFLTENLATGLALSELERDEFLLAAGHVPDCLQRLSMAEVRVFLDLAREAVRQPRRSAPAPLRSLPQRTGEPRRPVGRVVNG